MKSETPNMDFKYLHFASLVLSVLVLLIEVYLSVVLLKSIFKFAGEITSQKSIAVVVPSKLLQ